MKKKFTDRNIADFCRVTMDPNEVHDPAFMRKNGRLRIQSAERFGECGFRAKCNNVALKATEDISEPYTNPYPPTLGTKENLVAWNVPFDILKDGINDIEITMEKGKEVIIVFLDIAVE